MSAKLGDIDYNENEYLNLGASYPERNDVKAECYLINLKDEQQDEWDMYEENLEEETEENSEPVEKNMLESKFVASKIQELIESNFQVYDIKQKQYRNIKYKDYIIENKTKEIRLGNYTFPLKIVVSTFFEVEKEEVEVNRDKLKESLKQDENSHYQKKRYLTLFRTTCSVLRKTKKYIKKQLAGLMGFWKNTKYQRLSGKI